MARFTCGARRTRPLSRLDIIRLPNKGPSMQTNKRSDWIYMNERELQSYVLHAKKQGGISLFLLIIYHGMIGFGASEEWISYYVISCHFCLRNDIDQNPNIFAKYSANKAIIAKHGGVHLRGLKLSFHDDGSFIERTKRSALYANVPAPKDQLLHTG